MDMLPSVDALQEHLAAHDVAVRQIMLLDEYIERLCEMSVRTTLGGQMSPSFKSMIRIHVAEGIKRIYKEYRLKKWLQVQDMASVVRSVLSFAVDNDNSVDNMTAFMPQSPRPTSLSLQTATPALPLLSPIITPQRLLGNAITYSPDGVVPPVQPQTAIIAYHTVGENELFMPHRQLFQEVDHPTQAEYKDNISEDSAIDNSYVDEDISSDEIPVSSTSINHTEQPRSMMGSHQQTIGHVPQSVPGGYIQQDMPQAPHMEDFDSAEESDEEDDDMDWDEDMSGDENIAGVLFAASLLPEQQGVRMDVEMGDMGIGHVLFDKVSATWYTNHCEVYRAC